MITKIRISMAMAISTLISNLNTKNSFENHIQISNLAEKWHCPWH
nr:hypothetical protein [uncultured Flavobacterium sp.]